MQSPEPVPDWKLLASRTLVDRPWISIREERLELPHGAVMDEFHFIDLAPYSCVVCRDGGGRVILAEQFRRGLETTSLELPSGMIEPGEAPEAAARRELLEETGYEAKHWEPLGAFSPDPTRTPVCAHVFFASGAHPISEPVLDELEARIEVRLVSVDEALDAASDGRIVHAVHVAALWLAQRRGLLES